MLAVPQFRLCYFGFGQPGLHGARCRDAFLLRGSLVHQCSVGGIYFHAHGGFLGFAAVGELGRDVDVAVVARRNAQRMALEVEGGVGDAYVHAAEQSAAGIPARSLLAHRVCLHDNLVGLSVAQLVGYVNLESHVTVVRAADAFAVQEHVAYKHDAFEVEQHAAPLPFGRRGDGLAVIAFAYLLETAG